MSKSWALELKERSKSTTKKTNKGNWFLALTGILARQKKKKSKVNLGMIIIKITNNNKFAKSQLLTDKWGGACLHALVYNNSLSCGQVDISLANINL